MQRYIITTGTVTYAIKGRDLLRKMGYKANTQRRMSESGSSGCGYSIVTEGNIEKIEDILRQAGVKILEINEY